MTLLKIWLSGYYDPAKMVKAIAAKKSPAVGFAATVMRGLLLSLFTYLPQALLNNRPFPDSALSFVSNERYFLFLTAVAPLYVTLLLCVGAAYTYLVLRALGYRADIDFLFNLSGLVALVVGAFIIVWDWLCLLLKFNNVYFMGATHLVIDVWAITLTVYGLWKVLNVKVWQGILINVGWFAIALPLAMLIMRAPR